MTSRAAAPATIDAHEGIGSAPMSPPTYILVTVAFLLVPRISDPGIQGPRPAFDIAGAGVTAAASATRVTSRGFREASPTSDRLGG
ncbi:MAG TPA: hypothetical protein VKG80_23115 [Trebonia sp.]|nr:hypothetical protein [Trebonia sp.]